MYYYGKKKDCQAMIDTVDFINIFSSEILKYENTDVLEFLNYSS